MNTDGRIALQAGQEIVLSLLPTPAFKINEQMCEITIQLDEIPWSNSWTLICPLSVLKKMLNLLGSAENQNTLLRIKTDDQGNAEVELL